MIKNRSLTFFFITLTAISFAQKPVPKKTIRLTEIFSVEENPGAGTLTYQNGKNAEKIVFGVKSGCYGLGMALNSATLPSPYKDEFSGSYIIQIALGNSKGRQQQVPQFGVGTLVTKEIPKKKTVYHFSVPAVGKKTQGDMALLLFTSPTTPLGTTDEDKLKGTYFAQSGTITLTPASAPQVIQIQSQGKNWSFNVQRMTVELNSSLGTPFIQQRNALKGQIEFPIYWPHGEEAEAFAQKIVTESLVTGPGPVPEPEGLEHHKRELAGSSQKDAKPKASPSKKTTPQDSD